MTTHIHAVLAGDESRCKEMFVMFRKLLSRYFKKIGRVVNLSQFECKLFPIADLKGLRNRIVYDNRNGYLVCPDDTPFTYKWGANSFYFNREVRSRHRERMQEMKFRSKRSLLHSHKLDNQKGLWIVDGSMSPVCFCDIAFGESLFRDARHYFYAVSKEIESYKEVAEEVGDSLYYTDDELFSVVCIICNSDYAGQQATLLPKNDKISLSRRLHYDYNASNKQIARLLRLDISVVNSLYPH